MMMMRFVSVLLVALVGCRVVEADLTCDLGYNGYYYMADADKCWADELEATFWRSGVNVLYCDRFGNVSRDESEVERHILLFGKGKRDAVLVLFKLIGCSNTKA